jgi:hypothetical protein
MCKIKFIYFGLTVGFTISVFSAQAASDMDVPALLDECNAFSQAGMHRCLKRKAEESLEVLRRTENKMADAISKWDEYEKYIAQSKTKLTASKKEFNRYRDVQCEFMASLSGGGAGNSHEIDRLYCIIELNYGRVKQLQDVVSDIPQK